MYYYLAHLLKIDLNQINAIRCLYDPNYQFVDPHIAIIFPLDASVGLDNIEHHIESITKNMKSFPYQLSELSKSWDHYLYLEVSEGKEKFVDLHDVLYTGILEQYWFKEAGYTPHVTLGFFADRQAKFDKSDIESVIFNQKNYDEAIKMTSQMNLNFSSTCDKLSLVSRENKTSDAIIVKEFNLI